MGRNASDKQSLTGLARDLGHLSAETRRAALEVSAGLAGVSLRVSREFVSAVPAASEILSADDLRNWGELGRRLAMGSVDSAVAFFREGAEGLTSVTEMGARSLSSSIRRASVNPFSACFDAQYIP